MHFWDELPQYENQTALITECGEHISYTELVDLSKKIVATIQSRSLIFIICENNVNTLAAYIGCLRKKIVPLLLSADTNKILLNNLIEHYHPAYIYSENQLQRTDKSIDYTLNPELALLLTTSGSTGSPKLVRQSYQNLQANTTSIIEYLKIADSDRAITTMPMHYSYGLSIINTHLAAGATIVLSNKTVFDKTFWESIKAEKITTFGGVPYIYQMLSKLGFNKMCLPSLRYLTQAGGKLSTELCHHFSIVGKEKGFQFIVMYGQTEATARMSYLPWEYAFEKTGSIGIPIPGGDFVLMDSEDKEIDKAGYSGELVYKGENVSLGYAENPVDLSKGDENNGILYTGDLAIKDGDDFYTIIGRKSRFIKMYGNRINLNEVEQILEKAGYHSVCTGIDNCLKIFTTEAHALNEIKQLISTMLNVHHTGILVAAIEKIPRNISGKVLYTELDK